MYTEILMSNPMLVAAFGMVLEKKFMKSVIICYSQTEIRLLVVVARIGREEEWRGR